MFNQTIRCESYNKDSGHVQAKSSSTKSRLNLEKKSPTVRRRSYGNNVASMRVDSKRSQISHIQIRPQGTVLSQRTMLL